ncbi:AraC family transcriptional regulator [uncultured Tenacibaculum sp.]|uniref:AraC family transcriptional regulator n=1 Tax=uncultured Tenacibaculum sp. TaxID=174713 RepID=UPI00261975DF|nr:AraC family transcriptional regulator [uncultured Tenacibaculum sp.]
MKGIVNFSNKTITRIGKAIDYVESNLDKKLVLERVAKEAHFSSFHFHRLFKIVTNETLNDFIVRKRIEKAAFFLLKQKEKSITEVSERVGFTSLSSFSRAFKNFYGMSPAEFKKESANKYSKICKTESKNGQIETRFEQYICNINENLNWLKMNAKTEVKVVPEMQLAYLSHKGGMDLIGSVYNRLIQWAAPKGLMGQPNLRMVTIYHDSPKITSPDQVRQSACMVLDRKVTSGGEVNLKTLPATKCVVSRVEVVGEQFQKAWESSFVWMSEHGYRKGDQDPFEIYYNNAEEHPQKKWIVDLCIPVE